MMTLQDADWATILKMDGDPEGPIDHSTTKPPCIDCASTKLDHHETWCSIHDYYTRSK